MEYLISSLFDAQLLFCFECWLLQFECVYNGQQGQNLWTGDDHLRHHLANVGGDSCLFTGKGKTYWDMFVGRWSFQTVVELGGRTFVCD